MCMFCAAIPATIAAGAAAGARQSSRRRRAEAAGKTPTKDIPVKTLTILAVGGLVTASLITHSRMNS